MRTLALATVLAVAIPQVGHADDAGLPPPQVIPRTRGGHPVTPPPVRLPPAPPRPPAPSPSPGEGRGIRPPRPPGVARTQPLVGAPPPSQRTIERNVDDYLRDARPLIAPTSRGGVVAYDQGFLIRDAGFTLRANVLLQARYESFRWNDAAPPPAGDRAGFSLARAMLRLSGRAPCSIRYLVELDLGEQGGPLAFDALDACGGCPAAGLGPSSQTHAFEPLREAWVEWSPGRALNIRAGLLRTPTTRQLMIRPARQQFVDISLASAWTGTSMPGYTDRNRDFGVMLHGSFGAQDQLAWMITATNGDGGDGTRNVLDAQTSDNLAYAARLNWAFLAPIGHHEGALQQQTNRTYGEVGAWAFYYGDRADRPHRTQGDYLRAGVDLALGRGPWSFTGAFTWTDDRDVDGASDDRSTAWLAQLGHHFVRSAWELAVRWSGYDSEGDLTGDGGAHELAAGVNYHLNGHGNKLQLDVAYVATDAGGFLILDPYAAYPAFLQRGESGWLFRVQWQLAL